MDVVIIVFAFILLAIVFDTQSQGDHQQGKNISAGMQGFDNGQYSKCEKLPSGADSNSGEEMIED